MLPYTRALVPISSSPSTITPLSPPDLSNLCQRPYSVPIPLLLSTISPRKYPSSLHPHTQPPSIGTTYPTPWPPTPDSPIDYERAVLCVEYYEANPLVPDQNQENIATAPSPHHLSTLLFKGKYCPPVTIRLYCTIRLLTHV